MTGQQPGNKSEFIYIPPVTYNEPSLPENIRFITGADVKPWRNDSEENEIRCLDCEAMSHLFDLQSLNLSKPDTDLGQAMSKMQKTLLWILENSNWGSA